MNEYQTQLNEYRKQIILFNRAQKLLNVTTPPPNSWIAGIKNS